MIARKLFIHVAVLALLATAGLLVINTASVDAWGSDSDRSDARSSRKESNRSYERITYEVRQGDDSRKEMKHDKQDRDHDRKEQERHYKDDDVEVSVRGTAHVSVTYSNDCCNDSSHGECGGSGGHDDDDDGDVLGDSDSHDNHHDDSDDPYEHGDDDEDEAAVLELNVDTKVKINDGQLVDAETEGDAPVGEIGDTATWKVTVEADEIESGEDRDVRIHWQPPANVKPISHGVTNGTYDGSVWEVNIADMPAMLTVETQIMSDGVGTSNAVIAEISCDSDPSGFCAFNDGVNANNMNPASIKVLAAGEDPADPGSVGVLGASTTGGGQVLGESAVLAATGISTYMMILVGLVLALTPLVLVSQRQRN